MQNAYVVGSFVGSGRLLVARVVILAPTYQLVVPAWGPFLRSYLSGVSPHCISTEVSGTKGVSSQPTDDVCRRNKANVPSYLVCHPEFRAHSSPTTSLVPARIYAIIVPVWVRMGSCWAPNQSAAHWHLHSTQTISRGH